MLLGSPHAVAWARKSILTAPPNADALTKKAIEDLRSFHYKEQLAGSRQLEHLSKVAPNAVKPHAELLARLLEDPAFQIRRAMAKALMLLASCEDCREAVAEHIEALVGALSDERWQVRIVAIEAITALPAEVADEQAGDALAKAVQDASDDVRCAAVMALAAQGHYTTRHAPLVISLLDDADARLRLCAMKALIAFGKMVDPKLKHVPKIAKVLNEDESPEVRAAAAECLLSVGNAAMRELATLGESALRDPDESTRRVAMKVLSEAGALAAPQVSEAISSEDPVVQRIAIAALGEIALALAVEDDSPKAPRAPVIRAFCAESLVAYKKAKQQEKEERHQRRVEERQRKKAEERAAREAAGRLVFDDSDDEDEVYSESEEEELGEAELMATFEERAHQKMDDEVIVYMQILAGLLTHADEEIRMVVVEVLRRFGGLENPRRKLALARQSKEWHACEVVAR